MKPASLKLKLISCVTGMLVSTSVLSAGQVSSILISEQPATPFSYTAGGLEYNWGRGKNQLIEGFTANGRNFEYIMSANEVIVQRDDISGIASGEPCGIFVERIRQSASSRDFAADFPLDSSSGSNCRLESLLESRIINRGVVDAFSNKVPDAKNIERLDYLFYFGALAPLTEESMSLAGHVVAEKQGNNPVKVAAILSLDVFGQPAEYGPLVLVSEAGCSGSALCYGATDLVHSYSFLQNEFNAPQGFPVETEQTREAVNMAFVSAADLGLSPGKRYYGVSFFADDVDADVHTLIDPRTFPDDTSDDYIVPGDDADIYGGLTGYFLSDDLNVAGGSVFLDVDLDGTHDGDEAGISDITISLFSDVNGDGLLDPGVDEQVGDSLLSNSDGSFVFPGLPDGNFLVVLDEADAQVPAGLIVAPGTNPRPLTIGGGDSDPVQFAFVSESGTGSGSGNDGQDGGAGDGSDGGTGDGLDGGSSDGAGGGLDDDPDGGTGDGTDGGAGDGTDGGTGDGTDGGAGDGTDGGTGDGTDGGTGDGTDGGTGDGTDGGTGDGTDGGPNDGDPADDDATAANSDTFVVNQGETTELDVLFNDVDGTGNDSLTLVSFTESANATIRITVNDAGDQVLSYTPRPGYFSPENQPDTFTYTMEDGDGDQRTGNVSVTVQRFSDLNGNGINDFEECNCTDLFLETGVNGSGIGSVSRWWVFALALVGILRLQGAFTRRRFKLTGGRVI